MPENGCSIVRIRRIDPGECFQRGLQKALSTPPRWAFLPPQPRGSFVRQTSRHDCSDCFRLERIAGWASHPLESAAFPRRTPKAVVRGLAVVCGSDATGKAVVDLHHAGKSAALDDEELERQHVALSLSSLYVSREHSSVRCRRCWQSLCWPPRVSGGRAGSRSPTSATSAGGIDARRRGFGRGKV